MPQALLSLGIGRSSQALSSLVMALGLLLVPMSRAHADDPAAPVAAQSGHSDRAAQELTRTQATALVQRRYAARVVRAASAEEAGRHLYVFRLLSTAGKVWTVRIDAHSGAEVP